MICDELMDRWTYEIETSPHLQEGDGEHKKQFSQFSSIDVGHLVFRFRNENNNMKVCWRVADLLVKPAEFLLVGC